MKCFILQSSFKKRLWDHCLLKGCAYVTLSTFMLMCVCDFPFNLQTQPPIVDQHFISQGHWPNSPEPLRNRALPQRLHWVYIVLLSVINSPGCIYPGPPWPLAQDVYPHPGANSLSLSALFLSIALSPIQTLIRYSKSATWLSRLWLWLVSEEGFKRKLSTFLYSSRHSPGKQVQVERHSLFKDDSRPRKKGFHYKGRI